MAFNDQITPRTVVTSTFGSVATNGSSVMAAWVAPCAVEITGATILNGITNTVSSGTTSGSAASFNLYKNASNSGSKIASFNGSGTDIATQATQAMTLTTSTAIAQLATGDKIFAEMIGGAADNASNAGLAIIINYVAGRYDGGAPAAGTGPA